MEKLTREAISRAFGAMPRLRRQPFPPSISTSTESETEATHARPKRNRPVSSDSDSAEAPAPSQRGGSAKKEGKFPSSNSLDSPAYRVFRMKCAWLIRGQDRGQMKVRHIAFDTLG